MTDTTSTSPTRRTVFGGFTIDRVLDAAPARVFAAFADPALKAQWFGVSEDWELTEVSLDFRVGGEEVNHGRHTSGMFSQMWAQYQDIVPDERIVWTYRMALDGTPISVSLASVELAAQDGGTRLVFTEQDAFFDAFEDNGGREQGTDEILDVLAAFLARTA